MCYMYNGNVSISPVDSGNVSACHYEYIHHQTSVHSHPLGCIAGSHAVRILHAFYAISSDAPSLLF